LWVVDRGTLILRREGESSRQRLTLRGAKSAHKRREIWLHIAPETFEKMSAYTNIAPKLINSNQKELQLFKKDPFHISFNLYVISFTFPLTYM
jgi:hypothetical protein